MMDTHIVEVINVTREVAWLPWAVQYFFLIGLSVGGLLLSLPGYAFARDGWRPLGRLALIMALTCGLAAPVALLSTSPDRDDTIMVIDPFVDR